MTQSETLPQLSPVQIGAERPLPLGCGFTGITMDVRQGEAGS